MVILAFGVPDSLSFAGLRNASHRLSMMLRILPLCFLTILLVLGVSRADEKPTFKAGGLTFDVAKGWTAKAEARAMSAGGLTYKTAELKAGLDADFYHFGEGQGGSVEANIARWKGQFEGGKPKEVETSKLADEKIEFLHLEGTFMSGSPFGKKEPNKDHAMLGAILEHEGGTVFVKLTGPKEDVAKAVAAFKALIVSAYKKP